MLSRYVGEDVDLEADFSQLVGGVIWLVRDGEKYIDVSKVVECPDAQATGSQPHSANNDWSFIKRTHNISIQ